MMPRVADRSVRKLIEERLGVLQIGGVESLGEPVVHRAKEVVGFLALVLGLPQFGEAGGSAELPGFDLLVAGDIERLAKAGFCLCTIWDGLSQE